MSYKDAFELANKQRLICLKNAFNTIDSFIEPSYTPEMGKKYEKIKKYLLKQYSK